MSPHNTKKNDNGQPDMLAIQGVFPFWKQSGETLAVLLRRFREEHGLGEEEKITYAGRLDPMAEGVVPLLVGDARFQKERLLGAQKTYEVDVLLGIGTDTADMLGFVYTKELGKTVSAIEIEKAVAVMKDITELPYPQYSSRPVDGKPLFMHARAGKKVVVPIKKVVIHSMELKGVKGMLLSDILNASIDTIQKVQGDFRQEETIALWQQLIGESGTKTVQIVSIICTVSSGTYMRSLAERMGEILGLPALAYRIVRTSVGTQ